MQDRQEIIEGTPVRWLEHGSGRPVVLIHGIPTSPALWRHVMPLVNGRSLAWEMRGYGNSIPEGRDADIGLSAQADYLLAWLDSLDLEDRPILAGHDLGGGVAQIAAVRAPERFAGLVLTNAVAYDSWPIQRVKVMRRLSPLLTHLPEVLMYPSFVQLLHDGHDDKERALEAIGRHWAPYVSHGAAAALMRQMRALDVYDTIAVAGQLSSLSLPTRIVWGEADRFQRVGYGQRLADDLGASLTRIHRGKHFTPEDHPEAVAEAINDLLTGQSNKDD